MGLLDGKVAIVTGGVLAEDSADLLRGFFRARRAKGSASG